MEIKRIEGTSYMVSSEGDIINEFTNHHVLATKDSKGYLKVTMRTGGRGVIQRYVHRLVAEAFIPKPQGIPENQLCVKHKDFNKENNCVDNLEWDTFHNILKDAHKEKIYKNHLNDLRKKIVMIDRLNCREVQFNSLIEAAMYLKSIKEDLPDVFAIRANISTALNNENCTAYNYYWKEV